MGPPTLEAYISSNLVKYNSRPEYKRLDKQNLSPQEIKAIRELTGDKSIIIKPADKGGAIVILDRLDYLREGYKQLSDTNFYRHLEEDLTSEHVREISLAVEQMFQDFEIDESVKYYLID